jgi:predicted solute-binding protein
LGEEGKNAVRVLFQNAIDAGIIPEVKEKLFL